MGLRDHDISASANKKNDDMLGSGKVNNLIYEWILNKNICTELSGFSPNPKCDLFPS